MAEPSPIAQSCAAIILAAGASSRLGRPKQLVVYQGESLLRRTVMLALRAGAEPVLVVLQAGAADCRAALSGLAVTLLENADPGEGMGSSLRVGIAALPPLTARALLMVCDQPLLQIEDLRTLLHASADSGVAAAACAGRLGVPAVFSREHFPALAAVRGDQGARSLLRTLPATPVTMPRAAIDIDTPDDLANLEQA